MGGSPSVEIIPVGGATPAWTGLWWATETFSAEAIVILASIGFLTLVGCVLIGVVAVCRVLGQSRSPNGTAASSNLPAPPASPASRHPRSRGSRLGSVPPEPQGRDR